MEVQILTVGFEYEGSAPRIAQCDGARRHRHPLERLASRWRCRLFRNHNVPSDNSLEDRNESRTCGEAGRPVRSA